MKRILPILSIVVAAAIMMLACNRPQGPGVVDSKFFPADTAGLAQFQEWKALHERLDPYLYYDPAASNSTAVNTVVKKPVSNKSGSMNSSSSYPAKTVKKKGWSKAAKGATIGAATGGVLGAIINKRNRAVGAIVGVIVGGGVGYEIGHSKDKKDGRY